MISSVQQCKIFLEVVNASVFLPIKVPIFIYGERVTLQRSSNFPACHALSALPKFIMSNRNTRPVRGRNEGFSAIELLIVVVIIVIMSAISIPYVYNYQKVYMSEDQALKIIDKMQEARQHALSKRRTFRFEIDLTDNAMLIIDENGTDDDELVSTIQLKPTYEVRVDTKPGSVSAPQPPVLNDAEYKIDTLGHYRNGTKVEGHTVWAARFRSDGSVVDASNNPASANLYVWSPLTESGDEPRSDGEVRAITLQGASGAVRYWKFDGEKFLPY